MAQRSNDPKQVLIKAKKLPLSLLKDKEKINKVQLLDIEKHEVFHIRPLIMHSSPLFVCEGQRNTRGGGRRAAKREAIVLAYLFSFCMPGFRFWQEVFGPKSRRKRVKVNCANLEEMVEQAENKQSEYKVQDDSNLNKLKVWTNFLLCLHPAAGLIFAHMHAYAAPAYR